MNISTKVLLVNPNWHDTALAKFFVFPPVGILYLAGYVESANDAQVKIFDFQVETKNVICEINEFKPEIVGITCQTPQFPEMIRLVKEIKKRFPEITIVVGGSHPSVMPHEAASNPNIDVTVIGEGEITFSEIIKYKNGKMPLEDIKGIAYRRGDKIVFTAPRPLIANLNDLAKPAIHLIDLMKYQFSTEVQVGSKTAFIATTRGCPFNCSFCANKDKYQKTYRIRSIESLEEELDSFKANGIDSFYVIDDVFTLNKRALYSFCNLLQKNGYHFTWWAQTRADCIDMNMLRMMKKAGCLSLSFGIESGSDRLLNIVRKGVSTQQTRRAVTMTRQAGIIAKGNFILGLPQETRRDSLKTIWFALSLPLLRARFSLLVPYPGTELWSLACVEGQVKETGQDWENFHPVWGYSNLKPSYIPRGRYPEELKFLQKFANFIFYLKPNVVWDLIRTCYKERTWAELWHDWQTFLRATFLKNE